MGKIRITVEVGSIFPPTNIIVNVDSTDGTFNESFESDKSFTHDFAVISGKEYQVSVDGTNNEGDETVINVNGDFVPPRIKTTTDLEYSCFFVGNVN